MVADADKPAAPTPTPYCVDSAANASSYRRASLFSSSRSGGLGAAEVFFALRDSHDGRRSEGAGAGAGHAGAQPYCVCRAPNADS